MDVSKILTQLARKLKKCSTDEISKIEVGLFDIVVLNKAAQKELLFEDKDDFGTIINMLEEGGSVDDAHQVLVDANYTVAQLESLAKKLDIELRSKEKKEVIIDKIVQNTIGYKITSRAIRGDQKD